MNERNISNICYNCFSNLEDSTLPCPHCGFDLEENRKKYPVALQAGTVLNNRYIVGRVLGQGGFGITYLSWDTKLQAKVAVKEFMPNEIATRIGTTVSVAMESRAEDFTYGAERFQEEARTLAKFMGQPGIAGVTDYFDENDTSYFVMDYIEGISFKTYIANQGGKVTVDEALNVMIPVLRALTAVHGEGFIHRDVTPDNIYISKDGNVKLLDFGSARYSIGDKSKSLDVILKVGYAPKEQYIRRGRQGPYTDVYSCAACFYAALTGYLPPESLERLDQDTLIPPSQAGIELPLYLERAILKGLAVQPEDRFQSAAEFLDAIEHQQVVELAEAREVSDGSAEGQTTDRKQKRNPFLMGGIAAAVAVLVGIGVFMGGGQTGTEPVIGTPVGEEPSGKEDKKPLIKSEVPFITIRGEEYSTELRSLKLRDMGLENSEIQDLKYMVNLAYLDLRGNNITDLSPLASLTQMEEMQLYELPYELSDLSPLAGMTELKYLSLPVNSEISDLSPLSGLPKLESLTFDGSWSNTPMSGIKDLTPLSGMTGLKQLHLTLNGAVDLSPLANLTNLTDLRLHGNLDMKDFTPLSGMTGLQVLNLQVQSLESPAGLETLTNLQELEIYNRSNAEMYVSDLSFLSGMTKLQSLRLYFDGISSFKGMENLTELREASFYGDYATYTDVDPMKGMTKLQTLRLPSHRDPIMFDINGLAGMTELTELDMECSVTSLEPLRNLKKLKTLSARNGSFPDDGTVSPSLEPLTGLPELRELNLRIFGNIDLDPLGDLTNLRTLYLYVDSWHNNERITLTDISPLGRLTNLQSLQMYESGLTDLSPLANCTRLNSLEINEMGDPMITDLSPVSHVANVVID